MIRPWQIKWWLICLLFGAPDQSSSSEHNTLRRLVAGRKLILEIGSWMGASAVVLGAIAREQDGRLVCVDTWEGEYDQNAWVAKMRNVYRRFWNRIIRAGLIKTVIPMRGLCADVLPLLAPESFDAIWIDGDHRYDGVRYDIEQARRLITPGGLICGHDYDETHIDVMRAVDEAFGKPEHEGRVWWAK